MFPIRRYMEAKYGPAKDYPRRKISKDEFIKLLVQNGTPEEKARLQANISETLGSDILVNKEWLGVGQHVDQPAKD